uniref:Uncharacterized protein n=1 Tax=Ackermannviridae sp. ctaCq7 TaxID=2827294 RepID=A0A8S5R666_9CAUD|nr:MAG TPA: hypothetical protein [Ackermannviridae sp. ctaCq7]
MCSIIILTILVIILVSYCSKIYSIIPMYN